MSITVITESYKLPPVCKKEALRYAGCRSDADTETLALLNNCIEEIENKTVCKVCYCKLPLITNDSICDFGSFKADSKGLAKNLSGCESVVLFGATIGIETDRLIAKYGRLSPARALMFQAIGAERIEALCDTFCSDFESRNKVTLKPRFSPGYSDLPLGVQRDIFNILGCEKRIGLFLNESFLMSPSKSVTAFAGIKI